MATICYIRVAAKKYILKSNNSLIPKPGKMQAKRGIEMSRAFM